MKKLITILIISLVMSCDSAPSTSNKSDLEILQHVEKIEPEMPTTHTIHVDVMNNSDQLKDYVQVSATWYDNAGKIVGTGMGNTTNLPSKEKRTIDVIGLDINKAAKYELIIADHP